MGAVELGGHVGSAGLIACKLFWVPGISTPLVLGYTNCYVKEKEFRNI